MRTAKDIADNQLEIRNAMRTIQVQIALLETEYQQQAAANLGHRLAQWDEMKAQLETAYDALNAMWHMELDAADNK